MADASPGSAPGAGTSGPKPDGTGVYNQDAGYLNAEARRTLSTPTYSATAPSTVDIPRDTVLKRILMKLTMTVTATYSSGSPLFDQKGFFEKICANVEINVNGQRIIKSVRPHIARINNILLGASAPRRAYGFSASAPTISRGSYEWFAGTLAYPATTQYIQAQEAFELSFENPWGYGGSRHMTELDIRDVASAVCKFYWQNSSNLINDGNAATVTYTNVAVTVTPQIIENRARPRPQNGQVLFDYVETSFSRTYTGQARSNQIDLQTGNFLLGVGILCINGDAVYTLQENLLTNMALYINGATAIQGPVSHQDLQDENVVRFGCDDPIGYAANLASIATDADKHPLRGFGHMSLIRNGDWKTAINTSRQAGVDSVKLQFDTPSSSGTDPGTYTNAMQVILHSHEVRPYAYSR